MKLYKITLRIITYPFIIGILLITCIKLIIENSIRWLKYGGEVIVSTDKTPKTIAELFNLIEKP